MATSTPAASNLRTEDIIARMLAGRYVTDVTPEADLERQKRMFGMLRYSNRFRRLQMEDANRHWERVDHHGPLTILMKDLNGLTLTNREPVSEASSSTSVDSYSKRVSFSLISMPSPTLENRVSVGNSTSGTTLTSMDINDTDDSMTARACSMATE
ncbi:hypothetical protein BASA50_003497 [Batrachochytrium salamandrivorans]|uniref:Uncharacterized protein n=1 Tax=Batrachochytrium salamandrivorans TaxID=1357716 RepID=A0ABQ8FHL5_9FUNG|nr:hypothetical protein BASA60_005098 [Batrachochytrium salamandrivorans]KAH6598457.1 hypothetical protein BASA50_003497 [Batrachochytrium salamandrivorans]KAH6599140.1 hypothetical protein BASA61_002671 [Batrachochytrium salamandrivorans]KAH9251631.1 hypothetical protein BASA81_010472 [Batrachochytrium salamandrivorans]